ncbi:MAG: peptide/nickel transport system substrate-binding protein [Solirubrobacteraceae bacterium]
MTGIRRTVLAGLASAAAIAAVVVGTASGQEDGKPLVLSVGLTQDLDSANVTVGVTVAAFEMWNLQYATLTDKAAKDFKAIPGLAQSWTSSPDKKTWTYKLRPNLKWSDGRPLTSEDVAYTINRGRRDEWLNHSAIVANITASTPDPQTVVLKTSVPDPKLPVMDAYIVPKHVFSKYDKDALGKYPATEGVGSGPYTLERVQKGQFWRMKANPNYWKGRPTIDQVVFRKFNNGDAMAAALRSGQLDAVQNPPETSFLRLSKEEGIETLQGQQGGFDEIALNAGAGFGKTHPALRDRRVRVAIMHAIDDKTIIDRVMRGLFKPADAISPSADPSWVPQIAPEKRFDFDLAKARKMLDDAGYTDTDGDGIREMPGGGRPLKLRYAVRSESTRAQPIAEFVTGWLRDIGIATTERTYSDSQLTEVIGKGQYDMFYWGWTPFVDPDPMLSYFTCGQVSTDPKNPTDYYNDASWCDKRYDQLYAQQKVELDSAKRHRIVGEMLTRFHDAAVYDPLYLSGDLQAYRTDRFTGWTRQPAEIGPVLFSQSSPSYFNLKPVSASSGSGSGGGGGAGAGTIIVIAVAALVVLGGIGLWLVRRPSAEERE